MKILHGNFVDLEQLREKHERLLREFERLKDENRQLKDQLGHASIKMTVDVYGHLVPGADRQAVNRLPYILWFDVLEIPGKEGKMPPGGGH